MQEAGGGTVDASSGGTPPRGPRHLPCDRHQRRRPSRRSRGHGHGDPDHRGLGASPSDASTQAEEPDLQGHGDRSAERPVHRRDLVGPGGSGGGSVDASGNYTAPANARDRPRGGHQRRRPLEERERHRRRHRRAGDRGLDLAGARPRSSPERSRPSAPRSPEPARVSPPTVTWSVQEGAAGGSVDASGRYTAPGTPGTFHVVATSVADASKSATRHGHRHRRAEHHRLHLSRLRLDPGRRHGELHRLGDRDQRRPVHAP